MTGEDLLARAFLHETDHLNGRLYISHISVLKRDLIKRKVRKLQSRRVGLRRGNLRVVSWELRPSRYRLLKDCLRPDTRWSAVYTQPDRPSGRGGTCRLRP